MPGRPDVLTMFPPGSQWRDKKGLLVTVRLTFEVGQGKKVRYIENESRLILHASPEGFAKEFRWVGAE